MKEQDHKERVAAFIKKMKAGSQLERNMAGKVELLEAVLGNSLLTCTIQRGDIAPFAAITKRESPEQMENIYLPLDTVVDGFIGRSIKSVVEYIQNEVYKQDADEVKSAMTGVVIDRASYAEGMFDGLSMLGIALLATINEAEVLFQELLNKNQVAVSNDILRATGNPELDAMMRASLIINAVQQPNKKEE